MNVVHQCGLFVGTGALALLGGCMVGSNYQRATAPVPATYKELPPVLAGWRPATPNDAADRGKWWSIYQDSLLDELERKVSIDNQNLKASEASYRQARAIVDATRSNLFPTILVPNSQQQSTLVPGVNPPVFQHSQFFNAASSIQAEVNGQPRPGQRERAARRDHGRGHAIERSEDGRP